MIGPLVLGIFSSFNGVVFAAAKPKEWQSRIGRSLNQRKPVKTGDGGYFLNVMPLTL